jgi:hypothetical protein
MKQGAQVERNRDPWLLSPRSQHELEPHGVILELELSAMVKLSQLCLN